MVKRFDRSKRFLTACLMAGYFLAGATPALGQTGGGDFDYDIFLSSDTLAVWLDIRPALDQSKMEDLLAGLDLSFIINIRAERPRKLFFSKALASTRAAVLISHPLTEDVYRLRLVNFGISDHLFKNQLELSDFLSDSLIFRLAPKSLLEDSPGLRLKFEIVSKSHSTNVMNEFRDRPADSLKTGPVSDEEFFESLFSSFLNLIGFGKTSFEITTPPFSISDLTSF